MTGGRPLRFLAVVGVSWTTLRIALLWQETGSLPEAIRTVVPIGRAVAQTGPNVSPTAPDRYPAKRVPRAGAPVRTATAGTDMEGSGGRIADPPREADPDGAQVALLAMTRYSKPVYPQATFTTDQRGASAAEITPAIESLARGRLTFSSWMIARGGVGIGASPSFPQLGGTQGGIRADYAIGRGLAVTGRVAVPAAGAGREASLGIAWRPAGVPLRFVAEQRVALDGGRGGPALGVSGGVSEQRLPADFKLEGYAQAGAILRFGVEHYIDASARIARPIGEFGGLAIDLGAGAWGGAQRGVARIDVGPSIGVRAPIAGRTLRLSVDWRQRVAGSARPGSGPALSLGSDF